ncbi:MAG TPA: 4Fe-4S dicluster domain-containing protein [Methanomassiliicoccales archaeon]|nr:4Fe-4S dicluster domain-containing protein [Methanomassiliicoccales archaeon]
MTEGLVMDMAPEEGLKRLLAGLLASGRVEGVFALTKVEGGKVAYSLITSVQGLEECVPLYPLMPVNLGQVLTRFTFKGPASRPIAVVARPCELRAFVETVKRRQAMKENLVFISCTCGGVFPLRTEVEGDLEQHLDEYWGSLRRNEIQPGLRPACRTCVEFVPYTADLTLRLVEKADGFAMTAGTERGKQLLDGVAGRTSEVPMDEGRVPGLLLKRSEERSRLLQEEAGIDGMDSFISTFGRCIGCHACGKVCPICYCTSCAFESATYERGPDYYRDQLSEKEGVRLPPGMAQFHLGRMVHMAISCVACGQCQDVCPVDIPVSLVFKKVGESLQRTFNYTPGRDMGEALPLSAFEVEEFKGVGD